MLLSHGGRRLITNFILKNGSCLPRTLRNKMSDQAPEHVAGSMDFPFLVDANSVATLSQSNTIFILRGLPGSGKSTLARAIAEKYKNVSKVVSADAHQIKPVQRESLPTEYQDMDQEIESSCKCETSVIVVDDTHHEEERLHRLYDLADSYKYTVVIIEPRTLWKENLSELVKRSQWHLTEDELKGLTSCLEEYPLPYYFCWKLIGSSAKNLRETRKKFWEQLEKNDTFKKESKYFQAAAGEDSKKPPDLNDFFVTKPSILHCTTQFCDYGSVPGAREYAALEAVKKSYGQVFDLTISALFITPKTAGARVKLDDQELQLWPEDEEKDAEKKEGIGPGLPKGSRAHITLGCASDIQAVQTGYDLLHFVSMEESGNTGKKVETVPEGELHYFDSGMWMLYLSKNIKVQTIFTGIYHRKEPKKDLAPPKKIKKSCILI